MHLPTITVLLSLTPPIAAAYINPFKGDYSRSQAVKGSARHDSLTVYNSNCPCDRYMHKWCFKYAKYDVRDMVCYDVGQPSLGVSIYDPWVSADTPLECTVYREHGCQGEGVGWQRWKDNRECKEFGSTEKGETWLHRSFRCKHVGWSEGNTMQGNTVQGNTMKGQDMKGKLTPQEGIPNDKGSQEKQKEIKAHEKHMLNSEAEHDKWKAERKARWLEKKAKDELEDKKHIENQAFRAGLRKDAFSNRRKAIDPNDKAALDKLAAEETAENQRQAELDRALQVELVRRRKERDVKERHVDEAVIRKYAQARTADREKMEVLKNTVVERAEKEKELKKDGKN